MKVDYESSFSDLGYVGSKVQIKNFRVCKVQKKKKKTGALVKFLKVQGVEVHNLSVYSTRPCLTSKSNYGPS